MLVPHSFRFGGRKYLSVARPSLSFPGFDLKVRIRQDYETHYLNYSTFGRAKKFHGEPNLLLWAEPDQDSKMLHFTPVLRPGDRRRACVAPPRLLLSCRATNTFLFYLLMARGENKISGYFARQHSLPATRLARSSHHETGWAAKAGLIAP